MKFKVTITGHGPEALGFIEDEGNPFFILFNDDAPDGLSDICVLHTKSEIYEDPEIGDTLKIGSKEFIITAVGYEALHTLKELGHCTLNFTGASEAALPGCLMLLGCEKMKASDIVPGVEISIY